MRQAKIHWGGQPPRTNRARAAVATGSWAPPPTALYTGMAGLGLAAGAMLIAAGLARQPDIGAVHQATLPAAETLPAPVERPAVRPDEPAILAAAGTDNRVTPDVTPSGETVTTETPAAPVASRFGDTATTSQTAPPPMAASDAGRPDPGLAAFAGGDAPVRAPLPAQAALEPVEVAATEAEVRAIEERLAAQGDPNFVLPAQTAPDAAEPPATLSASAPQPAPQSAAAQLPTPADLPPAWAREHVNLRAGPDNDAPVLAIIPGNAAFAAEGGCEHWCAAVYEDQQGYVYSSFIRRDAP